MQVEASSLQSLFDIIPEKELNNLKAIVCIALDILFNICSTT